MVAGRAAGNAAYFSPGRFSWDELLHSDFFAVPDGGHNSRPVAVHSAANARRRQRQTWQTAHAIDGAALGCQPLGDCHLHTGTVIELNDLLNGSFAKCLFTDDGRTFVILQCTCNDFGR